MIIVINVNNHLINTSNNQFRISPNGTQFIPPQFNPFTGSYYRRRVVDIISATISSAAGGIRTGACHSCADSIPLKRCVKPPRTATVVTQVLSNTQQGTTAWYIDIIQHMAVVTSDRQILQAQLISL